MFELCWVNQDNSGSNKAIITDNDSLRDLITLMIKSKRFFIVRTELAGQFRAATHKEILDKITITGKLNIRQELMDQYWLTTSFNTISKKKSIDTSCRDAH